MLILLCISKNDGRMQKNLTEQHGECCLQWSRCKTDEKKICTEEMFNNMPGYTGRGVSGFCHVFERMKCNWGVRSAVRGEQLGDGC